MADSRQDRLRRLPQVGEMLAHLSLAGSSLPSWTIKQGVRDALQERRDALLAGDEADVSADAVAASALLAARELARYHLRRVVNATGVVVHTNLGRSPLAPQAVERLTEVAGRYANVEYDLQRGERGGRGSGVERLLQRLTGAEAALVVNNNASAVYLILRALAADREVVVSRGELVEIGGSFRIPDVMRDSGAVLREVGATNRTHPRDYEDAIGEQTALLMKVHRSNFQVIGFVAEVEREQLVAMGRDEGIPVVEDLGSGQLASTGVGDEPLVGDAVHAGVDLVCFSGDKLLGGCQAGLVVGRRELVAKLARHPLMRVLRADKLVYAALEGTLRLYLDGSAEQVPTHGMVRTCPDESREAAGRLLELLARRVPRLQEEFDVAVEPTTGRAGGGAMAQVDLDGHALRLRPRTRSAASWATRLRQTDPPLIVRVADDCVWIDPRTLLPGEDEDVAAALEEVTA